MLHRVPAVDVLDNGLSRIIIIISIKIVHKVHT